MAGRWSNALQQYLPGPGRPKGSKRADLSGRLFDHLTVLERVEDHVTPSGKTHPRYRCRCDCGEETFVLGSNLTSFSTTSCGHTKGKVERKFKPGDGLVVPADLGSGRLTREARERERRTNGL